MAQNLDTGLLPGPQQFHAYAQSIADEFRTPLVLKRRRSNIGLPYDAKLVARDADALTVGRIDIATPEGYAAGMDPVRHDEEVFCFNFLTRGAGLVAQDGHSSRVQAGEFAIFSNTRRLDNSVTYVSPAWKGFRLHAQYSFSADLKNDHSAEEGIQNGSEGKSSADRYWAAAMTYKQGPIDFAFIVDSYQWSSDIAKNAVYEGAVRDFDDSLAVTAGGSWNFGFLKAYAGVQWFQNAWKSWIGGGLFKVNSAADTQGVWGRDR